jgi:hypothetical protein
MVKQDWKNTLAYFSDASTIEEKKSYVASTPGGSNRLNETDWKHLRPVEAWIRRYKTFYIRKSLFFVIR